MQSHQHVHVAVLHKQLSDGHVPKLERRCACNPRAQASLDLPILVRALAAPQHLSFYYCTTHRSTADWAKEHLGHLLVQERGSRGKGGGGSGAAGESGGEQEGSGDSGGDSGEEQGSGGGGVGGVEGRGRLLVVPDPAAGDRGGSESESENEDGDGD